VSQQLSDLGFNQSRFEIELTTAETLAAARKAASPSPLEERDEERRFGTTGLDTVEFQFAPNPGEPPRPLRAIASSGELARVMLALKTALAEVDEIPVLVFDEVDANIGGETAGAVGEKMRQIAKQHQVLCITQDRKSVV